MLHFRTCAITNTTTKKKQSLSPEEQRLFRLYGKLPSRSDHFAKHLKERKYFDSGDYAMSKAGKGDGVDAGAVGSQHPVPENIPHLSSPISGTGNVPKHLGSVATGMQAGSPVKESSFLNRETTADGLEKMASGAGTISTNAPETKLPSPVANEPLAAGTGIPIRR